MSRKIFTFLFLSFFSFQLLGQGEVEFVASANAKQVIEGDFFQVTFKLKNGKWSRLTPPNFTGFQQHGNPSSLSEMSNVNGVWTSSQSATYNVKAKKKGKYTIGSATVVVNGKEIKSNKIIIEVVKGKRKTQDPDEPIDLSNSVFIKAEPSATDVKIGQQIILDYKIYSKVDIKGYKAGEDPDYLGFYSDNVRDISYAWTKEVIDGEPLISKLIKRVALYPQQAGLIEIDPLQVRVDVPVKTNNNRRRNYFFQPTQPIYLKSDTLQINVNPLPDGMPSTFSGGVGTYRMAASINTYNLTTDDALIITMTIRGNGDVKRVKVPDLGLGDKFELYEPSILEEKTFEYEGEKLGRKVFEYQAIPLEPGEYVIEPKFTYYDIDSMDYVTLASSPERIFVKQGKKRTVRSVTPKKEETVVEFLPIKSQTKLKTSGSSFFGSSFFWLLTVFPFVLLGAAAVYRQVLIKRGNIDLTLLKSQRAQKVAKQKLSEADKFLQNQDSKAFYNEISNASFGYVCDKLNMPISELSKANIEEKLQSLNVSQEYIDKLIKIIKTCEMALFAGMDNSAAMQETYQKTSEVIANIEEELTTDD